MQTSLFERKRQDKQNQQAAAVLFEASHALQQQFARLNGVTLPELESSPR